MQLDPVSARGDLEGLLGQLSSRLKSGLVQNEVEILKRAQGSLINSPGLLEWRDGPLVSCMRYGEISLLDEISLADDSALERLNSVLESSCILVLAEKGGDNLDESSVEADPAFKFVATMKPGGDYGGKELLPALRNRFTEIWVPSIMDGDELFEIIEHSWTNEELH